MIILIIIFLLASLSIRATEIKCKTASPIKIYAFDSDESGKLYIDSSGMLWIGTMSGLMSYDGAEYRTFKSDAYSPNILPNNVIVSITEDHESNLWIGTRDGLVRMSRKYGTFKTYHLPKPNQRIIYTLFTAKDGTVWIGTDGGLSVYNKKTDSFYTYELGYNYSVKSIVEDKQGNIFFGTWCNGVKRLRKDRKNIDSYPSLNPSNSAYTLLIDSKQRLWVGTWGYGIALIDNPNNTNNVRVHNYIINKNNANIIYKMIEDPVSNTIWACSRNGIGIMRQDRMEDGFVNYPQYKFCREITTDGYGHIFAGTLNDGILRFNTNAKTYDVMRIDLNKAENTINVINSLHTDDGINFWLGLRPCGIAKYNAATGSIVYNSDIAELRNCPNINDIFKAKVPAICKNRDGSIWFASSSGGVLMLKGKEASVFNTCNSPFITDNYVNYVFCDREGNVWIGQREGVGVKLAENRQQKRNFNGFMLKMTDNGRDFSNCDARGIMQDHKGNMWIATENEGIIRVSGDIRHVNSLKYKQYKGKLDNLAIDDITYCMEDSRHRIWAISNCGSLFLYNVEEDRFVAVNDSYHIMANSLFAISEGSLGDIWLLTDKSLIQLVFEDKSNGAVPKIRTYSNEDSQGRRISSMSEIFQYQDKFFIGSKEGILSLQPKNMRTIRRHNPKLSITDFTFDDKPFFHLDSLTRRKISTETPAFTRKITVPASVSKFSIEFVLLDYFHQAQNRYSYQLEGYDKTWHFTVNQRQATYENLPSGTYYFRLRAYDDFGNIQELPYSITIRVLPPWYLTWWAWMLYILAAIAAIWAGIRWYKNLLKTRNRLQMAVVFTNITHELLTPLAVITAIVDNMRRREAKFNDDYTLIDNNINKITRLLRQILEVRKAQAGQLKLKVSRGNMLTFIDNAVKDIRPMAEAKQVTLKLETIGSKALEDAWFDNDKLDEVIYNLISNSIKYNNEGGYVNVKVEEENSKVKISVEDNGIGMSHQQMKKLYERFYDGDYRRMKAGGTGIGLSLTRDLVQLHHGTINCKSHKGEGTTFTIILPIKKDAFMQEEIDTTDMGRKQPALDVITDNVSGISLTPNDKDNNVYKILIVEDNEELLALMKRLLDKKYSVMTAKNGKQALNIIHREELDIVISDVMMPVIDGIELTKAIKNDPNYAQLPVIMLTAKNQDEDRKNALVAGADDYITKPFSMIDLDIRVSNIIANRHRIRKKFAEQTDFKVEEQHYSNPDQAFVEKAVECVKKHISDGDYDRESFAFDLCISSSTLYNKLRAITGQNVTAFITSIRLKEACRILRENPSISVVELSAKVGFNTPKYFSKCFKKEFGMTVKDFILLEHRDTEIQR